MEPVLVILNTLHFQIEFKNGPVLLLNCLTARVSSLIQLHLCDVAVLQDLSTMIS